MRKFLLIVSFISFFWINAQDLKTGDLLFLGETQSDFSNAITTATGDKDSLNFIHVAIIIMEDKVPYIIEASSENGVHKLPYKEFLSSIPSSQETRMVVKRPIENLDFGAIAKNAEKHLGEPYDWSYLPDNFKMYCSELVYESYYTTEGEHYFESKPMNFRSVDGRMPEFWIKLFDSLGEKIPEGVEGTNPNDMARSPKLIEIYRR